MECILHSLGEIRIDGEDDGERDTSCVIHGTPSIEREGSRDRPNRPSTHALRRD